MDGSHALGGQQAATVDSAGLRPRVRGPERNDQVVYGQLSAIVPEALDTAFEVLTLGTPLYVHLLFEFITLSYIL